MTVYSAFRAKKAASRSAAIWSSMERSRFFARRAMASAERTMTNELKRGGRLVRESGK